MKKGSMKLLIVVALIGLLAVSWYTMFNDAAKLQSEYDGYISVARDKKEKELYDDAIDSYNSALNMHDSIELREEIADLYKNTNKIDQYLEFCEQTTSKYPQDERAYVRLAEYYSGAKDYNLCFKLLNKADKKGVSSNRLKEIRTSIQYVFEYKYMGFETVSIFSNDLCAVKRPNGNWGYVNLTGGTHLGFNYTDAADYTGEYLAVQLVSGEYVLVDSTGREKSKDTEKKIIEDCLFLFEDKMSVKYDGKYHYCNSEFKKLFGDYDYAGTFSGGFAAVMNEGKWFVINAEGKQVSDNFEEIKVDEKGVAFRNGVAFAKTNGKYILIDTSGKKVGDGSWADVDCFNSDQPAAVSNGDRWGFIDATGKLVVDYTYGKARSFSNGFAAVAVQDKWGYIIIDDYSLKIEHQFVDAMDFSRSGTAFVKQTDGWDLIKLYSYNQ